MTSMKPHHVQKRTNYGAEFETMRKRLLSLRSLDEEIENQSDRLERMRDKVCSASSPNLTGMPKSPSAIHDRNAEAVARIADLQNDIDELVLKRNEERKAIEELVKMLEKSGEKSIIRSRYLDHEDWEDVQFVLFGGKSDFNDKYDEYKQKMFRWHRNAISNLSMMT